MFGSLRTLAECKQALDILIMATAQDQEEEHHMDLTTVLVRVRKQSLWRWCLGTSWCSRDTETREPSLPAWNRNADELALVVLHRHSCRDRTA